MKLLKLTTAKVTAFGSTRHAKNAAKDDPTVGGALNVKGDDAAAAIAAALGAAELFLMIDVAAVLDADKQRIATLSLDEARGLVASGVAGGGMAAKLDASAVALAGGVAHVRIGDLAALSVPDAGTVIVPSDPAVASH